MRAIPGTGLGLTITKLLTQIMGGEINATSTEGVGTTFTVRLLLSEAIALAVSDPATNAARAITRLRRRAPPAAADRRRRLAHRHRARACWTPLGFELYRAPDGAAGLTLAAQCRPDLAMVDLSMPGMTGWQVAAVVARACRRWRALRIVIVSANAHEYSPGGDGATHDAFLIKPIDMQRLLECLAAQLGIRWVLAGGDPAAAR